MQRSRAIHSFPLRYGTHQQEARKTEELENYSIRGGYEENVVSSLDRQTRNVHLFNGMTKRLKDWEDALV
jgi:hypothetical protein